MPDSHRFGRVEVRPAERALLVDGKPVELGSRAFDLLLALISHRDHVMTKDELLDMVWPGVVVEENNLQVQVSALRKALGPQAIATVPGRGYQFVAPEPTDEAPIAPALANFSPVAGHSNGLAPVTAVSNDVRPLAGGLAQPLVRWREYKGRVAIVAGTVAVLAGIAGYWLVSQPARIEIATPASSTTVANKPLNSLVVLPFVNLTGDSNQAYFADGLTASMTADLSRMRDAFIVDAATAFSYKDKPVTAQQLGRELGVRFVLQGNVQRTDNKIRINAQLADATSNAQIWSESFDGDLSDMFALYDQVTARIGNTIGIEITRVLARDSEKRKSTPRAADLLLRADAMALRSGSLKNLQQRESWCREALALEPNNAGAMAHLANSLSLQALGYPTAFDDHTRETKYGEARDLALKVKVLDPENLSIYITLATYALAHDDFDGARHAAETHASRAPWSPVSPWGLGVLHFYSGEPERAIELFTQAGRLNPNGPNSTLRRDLCRAHFMLGDYDGAIQWCLKSLDRVPTRAIPHAYLAMAYSAKGDDAKARAAVAELRKLPPEYHLSDTFQRPQSSYPAAYKDWYEKKFLPVALKVGLWEKK